MVPQVPLANANFRLNSSGIASYFGEEDAIRVYTIYVCEGRKWLGWYNSPGSYAAARKYGRLADSGVWGGLFPSVPRYTDPIPEFRAVHSETSLADTGYTGHLFANECEVLPATIEVQGRITSPTPVTVTVANLNSVPDAIVHLRLPRRTTVLLAGIPMIFSLSACILCGAYRDWYCFSTILLGIVANGLFCIAITSGSGEMVILLGEEGAVNSVTRGKFSLVYADSPERKNIGRCSFLLMVQLLVQLLLTPQGTLFGQIMFLSTLAVSWTYNAYLSSIDIEKIQRNMLVDRVLDKPKMTKYRLGTRSTMAVFVLLVLQPPDPEKMLNYLLPGDTETWRIWKKAVLDSVKGNGELYFDEAYVGFQKYGPGMSDDVQKVA
ncbi:hypothetical protein PILCRDRAFT_10504 [Piloderma croceum F 1598]|uniref:Uncharacterized protein n=1 Tax=Piloderma croceum (strain F 1598) TaxID=765440 RepID=A0A0C3BPY0_PILCF|nr:hypothetical protein PILCRDRAFT_10504 [Piloderma croceum F 1598]